jgi:DNA-binding NtrC family response regulator
MAQRILIVDDHTDSLACYVAILERAGYEVVRAESGAVGDRILRMSAVDVVIADLKMRAVGGLDILRAAKEADPETSVILVTGFPTVETAVEAMKLGAFDYLTKPFTEQQLLGILAASVERRRVRESHGRLLSQLRTSFTVNGMVGRSRPMLKLFNDIRRTAEVDANVLILGESGVGKERVAQTIVESSDRRGKPFLAINCAAIPEALLEAELFGHERGAFTGAETAREGLLEAADGGALFLDELCEMPLSLQAKLLRALEERSVRRVGGRKAIPADVRFIASTNRDIQEAMRGGRFRKDLFFRIDGIEIWVPPLRERRDDIPLLATHFLGSVGSQRRTRIEGFTPEAMALLTRYEWPGNVRELKNAVERAAAYTSGPFITRSDLPQPVVAGAEPHRGYTFRVWKEKTLERLEREFVKQVLEEHGNNISWAARALGIHRSTLHRVMRRHNLADATS